MAANNPALSDDARRDIQGLISSGYGHLAHAAYLFFTVQDPAAGRAWLAQLVPAVTTAREWPVANGRTVKPAMALNVAFSAAGLAAFGLSEDSLCSFPVEFREGMADETRSRILGDTEESDPAQWELGGPGTPPIHVAVVIHASTEPALEAECLRLRTLVEVTAGAVAEVAASAQRGYRPDDDHEPFGFRDGITQPSIAGLTDGGEPGAVPTGEFVLGYPNHFAIVPPTPVVPPEQDPESILPRLENPWHASRSFRDLGRNGTYVVYRKLQQDVGRFWQFMRGEAARVAGADDVNGAVALAARCVGRWPSGAPLVLTPNTDRPEDAGRDDFGYRQDALGLACPIGAHIRRTNPRDDLKPYPAAQSLSMTEAHRLLRRARVFGPLAVHPEVLSNPARAAERTAAIERAAVLSPPGIHFLCLNASIKRQFEFVQQNWCNNPRFGGLNDNKDPVAGDNARTGEPPSHMTVPHRLRTAALPRFVTVRGGAYLFMPSLTALRYLSARGSGQ